MYSHMANFMLHLAGLEMLKHLLYILIIKKGTQKTLFTKKFFESFHKYDNNGVMNMNV